MDDMPSPFSPSDQLYIDKYYCNLANKQVCPSTVDFDLA